MARLTFTETDPEDLDENPAADYEPSGIEHPLEDELIQIALPRALEVVIDPLECNCEDCQLAGLAPEGLEDDDSEGGWETESESGY